VTANPGDWGLLDQDQCRHMKARNGRGVANMAVFGARLANLDAVSPETCKDVAGREAPFLSVNARR
jgi:hypothetical protein